MSAVRNDIATAAIISAAGVCTTTWGALGVSMPLCGIDLLAPQAMELSSRRAVGLLPFVVAVVVVAVVVVAVVAVVVVAVVVVAVEIVGARGLGRAAKGSA